jgi:hypothetical protein
MPTPAYVGSSPRSSQMVDTTLVGLRTCVSWWHPPHHVGGVVGSRVEKEKGEGAGRHTPRHSVLTALLLNQ